MNNSIATNNISSVLPTTTTTLSPMPDSGTSSTEPATTLLYALSVGEFGVLNPFVVCIAGLNLFVLWNTKIVHPNLKVVFVCEAISIVVFECLRSAMLLNQFIVGSIFASTDPNLQSAFTFVDLFRRMLGHVLVVERALATWQFRTYEQQGHRLWFSLGWFSLATCICLLSMINRSPCGTTLANDICLLALMLLSLVEFFAIGAIGLHNREKYAQIAADTRRHHLNEKYQLFENIRTSKQLSPVLLLHFFGNAVDIAITAVFRFSLATQPIWICFAVFGWLALNSVVNALIEITIITHHPVLKNRLRMFFKRITLRRRNQVGNSDAAAHNIKSAAANNDEAEAHFVMLKELWN